MSNGFEDELKKMGVPQEEIEMVDRIMNAVHERLGINKENPETKDLPKVIFLYRVFSTMTTARVLGLEPLVTAEILHAAADAIELAEKELNRK